MKCEICHQEIEETFLGKISGTVIKVKKGDKIHEHFVCNRCQREYKEKVREKVQ